MTPEQGLQSQLRNIEAKYGHPIGHWVALIQASGLTRHADVVAMLKRDHGMAHGAAHRVALTARAADAEPESELFAGAQAHLRPIHDRLLAVIEGFGDDVETATKKGYLSLRRRKQFAMLKPAARHVDVGLILPGDSSVTPRLESAATFNALFTHRVRVATPAQVDEELIDWLRSAYDRAG